MNIGERIKAERERLGHTQEDWANTAGIHRNTQAKYEKGEAVPDVSYLSEIESIGADIDFVRTGERRELVTLADAIDRQCVIIAGIVEGIEQALMKQERVMTPSKKAQAAVMLYRAFSRDYRVDKEMIEEVVKLAAS